MHDYANYQGWPSSRLIVRAIMVVALIYAWSSNPTRGQDSPINSIEKTTAYDRFQKEAPLKWKEMETYFSRIEGLGSLEENYSPAGTSRGKVIHRRINFLAKGDCARMISYPSESRGELRNPLDPGNDFARGAIALNDRYCIMLTYRKSNPKWVLEGHTSDRAEIARIRLGLSADWAMFAWAPWSIGGVSFRELIEKPGFAITDIKASREQGRDLVDIRFTYTPTAEERKRTFFGNALGALRGGVLSLWPDEHWCLVHSKVDVAPNTGSGTEEIVVEYGDRSDGFLLPARVECIGTIAGAIFGGVSTRTFKFERLAHREAEDREFELSAFELPDDLMKAVAQNKVRVRTINHG